MASEQLREKLRAALRTALALSRNLCTIRVVQQMGVQKVIERAKDLELEPHFPEVLSVSLQCGQLRR